MVSARKAKEAEVAKTEGLVFRIALGTAGFFVVVCLLPTVLVMVIGLVTGRTSAADPWNLLASAEGYPVFHPQAAWLLVPPAVTMFVLSVVTMPMGMGSGSAVDRPTLYVTSYGMAVLGFLASIAFQDAPDAGAGALVGLVAAGLLVVAGVLFHVRNFLGSLDFVPWSWRPDLPEPAPPVLHPVTVTGFRATGPAGPAGAAGAAGGSATRVASVRVRYDYLAWIQVPEYWPWPVAGWDYPDADDWATFVGENLATANRVDEATARLLVAELRTIAAECPENESRFIYSTDLVLPLVFVRVRHGESRTELSLEQVLATDAPTGTASIKPRVTPTLGTGIHSLHNDGANRSKNNPMLTARYARRAKGIDVLITADDIPAARSDELLAAIDTFAQATRIVSIKPRPGTRIGVTD
ncbi:hypothetical protein [Cryobacterium sp.]|uniref:hypothetical protein n=1 Tax=Cryobacterium sp. TaxID=1926290 RepID=UPI00261FA5F3|nr:hypothetical protein [Cryobacterium sp.]MCU1445802.1 hypothetical protein [Cryobacterium sp.]